MLLIMNPKYVLNARQNGQDWLRSNKGRQFLAYFSWPGLINIIVMSKVEGESERVGWRYQLIRSTYKIYREVTRYTDRYSSVFF